MTALRWLQPAPPPADFWRVYRDGTMVQAVVVEPDGDGVRSVELDPWPVPASYTMTAVNAAGESPISNALALPEPSSWLTIPFMLAALLGRRTAWRSPWS